MKGILVDSNIILDVFLNDLKWADWSESKLVEYSDYTSLYINSIIYSEISIAFKLIEDLEGAIIKAGFQMLEIPKEALFLAGKAYLKYKKRKGVKRTGKPKKPYKFRKLRGIANVKMTTDEIMALTREDK